jgi:hypothetical protein
MVTRDSLGETFLSIIHWSSNKNCLPWKCAVKSNETMYRLRVKIERVSEQLEPDPTRVIPRFFGPGDEKRLRGIIERIRALDRSEVSELVSSPRRSFRKKHPDLAMSAKRNYDAVKYLISDAGSIGKKRQLLIGAYFTMEYAIESAALFNPSMVPAIIQDEADVGSTRNIWIWLALALCLVLILAAVYTPVLRDVMELSDPGAAGWLVIVIGSLLPLVVAPVVRYIASGPPAV